MEMYSQENSICKKINSKYIVYLAVFIAMFLFFYVEHPFILYDTDDWFLISKMRAPFPSWGSFNPAKVFPEVFMPLCGLLASVLVYPVTHNYLLSIAFICAVVASVFITAYVIQFDKFITEKFHLNNICSCCLSIIFLAIHFLIFKKEAFGNDYLLGSINVCCYFNYTIPALLNATLVLYFMRRSNSHAAPKSYVSGWLVLLLYLAICSNLFCNIILAMYAFYEMILDLFREVKTKKLNLVLFLKQHIFYESILAAWLLSLIFEYFGQRSAQVHKSINIKKSFLMLAGRLYDFDYFLLAFFIILFILAIILMIRKQIDAVFLETEAALIISCLFLTVYLILLAAVVSPGYMRRTDIIFAIFFYVFLGAFICLCTILSRWKWMNLLLPLLCFVFLMSSCNPTKAFRDTNSYNLAWEKCYEISNDLLEEMKNADKNDIRKITLHVPLGSESSANWPHATYLGDILSHTLVRHGVISSPVEAAIEPDTAVNEKYCIP